MSWDAAGAIGEIIGAFAVVVTLAYFAIQIRVSRSAAADANRLTRTNGVREWCLALLGNDKMLKTFIKGHGIENYVEAYGRAFDLPPEEAGRLDVMHQFFFWLHYGQFASTNDEKSRQELRKLAVTFYNVPSIKYSWENSPYGKSFMDPEFVSFIDEVSVRDSVGVASEVVPPREVP